VLTFHSLFSLDPDIENTIAETRLEGDACLVGVFFVLIYCCIGQVSSRRSGVSRRHHGGKFFKVLVLPWFCLSRAYYEHISRF